MRTKFVNVFVFSVTLVAINGQYIGNEGGAPVTAGAPWATGPPDLYPERPTDPLPTAPWSASNTDFTTVQDSNITPQGEALQDVPTQAAETTTRDKFSPDVMPPDQFFRFLEQSGSPTEGSASGEIHGNQPSMEPTTTTEHTTDKFNPDRMPPNKFMEWLSGNSGKQPTETKTSDSSTDKLGIPNKNQDVDKFNPDLVPPEKFMEWLQSNRPIDDFIEIKKEANDGLNEHKLSKKLIIIISTVSGTVCLSLILVVILCCYRRAAAKKEAKIKAQSPIHDQINQDVFVLRKQDPSMFMGIPANNDIWKDLQTLPETASVVIPESGKE